MAFGRIRHLLKEQCHAMEIFFEGLNILISTFCVCADDFQDLPKAFNYPVSIYFQCQNHRFRVIEARYWEDFQS